MAYFSVAVATLWADSLHRKKNELFFYFVLSIPDQANHYSYLLFIQWNSLVRMGGGDRPAWFVSKALLGIIKFNKSLENTKREMTS